MLRVVQCSWLSELRRVDSGLRVRPYPDTTFDRRGLLQHRAVRPTNAFRGALMKMMISTCAGAVPFAARLRRQTPYAIVARVVASAAVIGALACSPEPATAQFTQQGPKLVGSGAVGEAVFQGHS